MMRAWAALVAVFGLGVAYSFTGHGGSRDPDLTLGWGLVAAALFLALTRSRWAALIVAAVVYQIYREVVPSTMTVHIIWTSAALALFKDVALREVLRMQAVVVYVFAAVNKLWPAFLTGAMLEAEVEWLPQARVASATVIVGELLLAVAVLGRWRWAPVAVLGAHLSITLVAGDPLHAVTLLTYGGMMLFCVVSADSGLVVRQDPGGRQDRPRVDRHEADPASVEAGSTGSRQPVLSSTEQDR